MKSSGDEVTSYWTVGAFARTHKGLTLSNIIIVALQQFFQTHDFPLQRGTYWQLLPRHILRQRRLASPTP